MKKISEMDAWIGYKFDGDGIGMETNWSETERDGDLTGGNRRG
jgi:hypothetical protein